MDNPSAKDFDDFLKPDQVADGGLKKSVSIKHQKQPANKETEASQFMGKGPAPTSAFGKAKADGRTDITIQRKKNTASMVNGKQSSEQKPKEQIESIQERLNESYDSSSLMEEREDNLQKIHMVKKLDKGSRNVSNLPSAMLPNGVGSHKADYYFNNHKKITSLDEFYVESNYFKRNNCHAYAGHEVNFDKDAFVAQVVEARYLPDTSNFLKVRGFFYSGEGYNLSEPTENIAKMDGDSNQQFFDLVLKLDKFKNNNYDEVYLFLIWETFQDIFGDDDIEFTPLIFGFSIVKLFEAEGLKSLSTTVATSHQKWNLARGLFQIGVYQPFYLKLGRQELIRRFR
jgi:hypothetical protein